MNATVSRAALAAALLLAAPAVALADDAAPTATAPANESVAEGVTITGKAPTALNLTVPSTAGSRLDLTPLETPATVSVISGDFIRNIGYLSVVDAISAAPGLTSSNTPGNGGNSFGSRGFFGPNSVAELYDGMLLFNGGGVVVYPFDPWNVDRIEVLYGPADVLYGAGSIGGAINVAPKRPDPAHPETQLLVGFGSYNTQHEALDSTGPITDKLSYRLDVSNIASTGWVQNSKSQSIAISAALRYDVTSKLHLTLSDDYGDINPSSYEGTPIINGAVVPGTEKLNYNIADPRINFTENRISLKADWEVSPDLTITNDGYYITQHRHYQETYTYAYQPATQTVKRTNYRDIIALQDEYGDHGFATWSHELFGLKNEMVAGFDANHVAYKRYDNTTASGSFPGTTTVNAFNFDPGPFSLANVPSARPLYVVRLDQIGGFFEDRLTLTPQINLVAGVRTDSYHNERDDREYTLLTTTDSLSGTGYHVGATYEPIKNLVFYAQYATAVDPVTSFASASAANQVFGLSPGEQYEFGVKQDAWGGRLQWTIDAYHIVKKNLVTPSLSNPAVSVQVGQQSSEGVEASLVVHITHNFLIDANGTFLTAKFDDFTTSSGGKAISLAGFRPFEVPDQAANIRAIWDITPEWQLRGGMQYVGDRFADNTDLVKMPSYAIYDFGLRFTPTAKWKFDLRLANALNATYVAATATGVATQFILGEPRNVMGTLTYAW